jgi:hypothetical protein
LKIIGIHEDAKVSFDSPCLPSFACDCANPNQMLSNLIFSLWPQAGGWLSRTGRVNGELDMTRSLGDADLKQVRWQEQQAAT